MCEGGGDDGVGTQSLTEAVYTCNKYLTFSSIKNIFTEVKYHFLLSVDLPLGDMEVFERFRCFRPMGSLAS